MMEKKQSEELIATSADFNSSNVKVLLCKQDNYLCVLANRKVNHSLQCILSIKHKVKSIFQYVFTFYFLLVIFRYQCTWLKLED